MDFAPFSVFIQEEKMKDGMLEIGKIVNTHGIRGELKVQPWCDDPEVFNELEYIYIGEDKYDILRSRLHKNCIILLLDSIDDINIAEKYKNKIIKVEREQLGELPEGTYYIADLEGLEVRTDDGNVLGTIDEIIKTGSNDVYVLKAPGNKPILIPVIDEVVKEVNINEGYVLVKLLEGLID